MRNLWKVSLLVLMFSLLLGGVKAMNKYFEKKNEYERVVKDSRVLGLALFDAPRFILKCGIPEETSFTMEELDGQLLIVTAFTLSPQFDMEVEGRIVQHESFRLKTEEEGGTRTYIFPILRLKELFPGQSSLTRMVSFRVRFYERIMGEDNPQGLVAMPWSDTFFVRYTPEKKVYWANMSVVRKQMETFLEKEEAMFFFKRDMPRDMIHVMERKNTSAF